MRGGRNEARQAALGSLEVREYGGLTHEGRRQNKEGKGEGGEEEMKRSSLFLLP
jgi:hypothetical protein